MTVENKMNSGANRKEAEEILVSFLKDENLKVLVIKGKWGVGKTHLVRSVLRSHSKQFYYGSLFGISSLKQLKAQILINKYEEPTSITDKKFKPQFLINRLKRLKEQTTSVFASWMNENSQQVAKIPKLTDIPVSGAVISIAGDFLLNSLLKNIKKTIIYIDDLERKSGNLQLDELIGFIDYLVQESQSKIILLYNEERLYQNDDSKKLLDDYREKIIDIEVLLEPTVEENVELVFKNDPDIEIIQKILRMMTSGKNIRILKTILGTLNKLRPFMENWVFSLRNQLIANIIILIFAKFDTQFPVKFERIAFESDSSIYPSESQEELEAQLKDSMILCRHGYSPLELDIQIVKLIETSLFEQERFISVGDSLNAKEEEKHLLEKYSKLWEPYFDSFKRNESDIAENINQFLQDHYLDLPIREFEEIEQLASVVNLDISSYKKDLLEKIISTIKDIDSLQSIKSRVSNFPDLMSSIESKILEWETQQNITSVISVIAERHGWSQEDVKFLSSRTIDDYYQWLQEDIPDLCLLVKKCLEMNVDGSQKLRNAIVKLSGESKLNAMRARLLYGIVSNDEEHLS